MKFIALFVTFAFCLSCINANPARLIDSKDIEVGIKSNQFNQTHRFNHSIPASYNYNETHRHHLNFTHPNYFNGSMQSANISSPFYSNNMTLNYTWPNSTNIYRNTRYHQLNSTEFFNGTKSNMSEVDIYSLPTLNEVKSLLSELRTIESSLESKLNDLSAFTNNETKSRKAPHYHTEKEEIKVTEKKRRTEKKGNSEITEDFETKKYINREKSWDE